MKYLINTKTGTIHGSTSLLLKQKTMIPAPDECAEMHEKFGIESFKLHGGADGLTVFEPIIPVSWRHPEWLAEDEQEAARERLANLETYVLGRQAQQFEQDRQSIDPSLVLSGQVPNSAPITSSRGTPAAPTPGGEISVPDDFNLDINISTLNKAQLLGIARQINNLPVNSGMKVGQIREAMTKAISDIKAERNAAATAEQAAIEAAARSQQEEERRKAEAAARQAEEEEKRKAEAEAQAQEQESAGADASDAEDEPAA